MENDCRSVALPAISTGVYGYPLAAAARVSLSTVIEFQRQATQPELVRFVLFGDDALRAFEQALLHMPGIDTAAPG